MRYVKEKIDEKKDLFIVLAFEVSVLAVSLITLLH